MISVRIKIKDSLGRWLGGLESIFRRGGRERREIPLRRGEPLGDAEEALWQAMGWNEPQGGSGAREVVSRAAAEALRE
jgi:hypothetical protein